ncbi:MAG: threonine synthase [Candidatus Marinimicrobia bacterium]|nr:threonine synthase [Candidatus Neomarinimicrobiota bacterium]
MKYISTNTTASAVSLKDAVLTSMPSDGGLYMPEQLIPLDPDSLRKLPEMSFQEVSLLLTKAYLEDDVQVTDLEHIVSESMNFDVQLHKLDDQTSILETFHGPTMAFKDFGARFMAQLMSHLIRGENHELTILVATSGDTGSAVASGFLGIPGIRVIILYPSGKVSHRQEMQLTTQGQNITALEVDGSFDDCQQMVKIAFVDQEVSKRLMLSSANSINIARLLPQSFYFTWAAGQVMKHSRDIVFSVPCGNFGNITAGLIAKRMGVPIQHFVAATNLNAVFPEYLKTGLLNTRPSHPTISNAMDVGNPSNLDRIRYLYEDDLNRMRSDISSWSYTDDQTRIMIQETYSKFGYISDPHTAVGLLGYHEYQAQKKKNMQGIVISTAHPAKFPETVEPLIDCMIDIPPQLTRFLQREKQAMPMSSDYTEFKQYLLDASG